MPPPLGIPHYYTDEEKRIDFQEALASLGKIKNIANHTLEGLPLKTIEDVARLQRELQFLVEDSQTFLDHVTKVKQRLIDSYVSSLTHL